MLHHQPSRLSGTPLGILNPTAGKHEAAADFVSFDNEVEVLWTGTLCARARSEDKKTKDWINMVTNVDRDRRG